MIRHAPRRRRTVFPALRGTGALALLLLASCTVGMDDNPVPPELIPNAGLAQTTEAGTYGAPAESAASVMEAAAPAYSASSNGESMVWQTGAQPVVTGRTSLAEPVSPEETVAGAQGAPPGEQDVAAEEPEAQAATIPDREAHVFRLAPFVGLEADAGAPLREAMEAGAGAQGIRFASGSGLVLKGYLSSMEENGASVLIYVWDVYDGAGTRLTRIDGQQELPPGAGTEPLSIDAATARKVAARTLKALGRWQPDAAG